MILQPEIDSENFVPLTFFAPLYKHEIAHKKNPMLILARKVSPLTWATLYPQYSGPNYLQYLNKPQIQDMSDVYFLLTNSAKIMSIIQMKISSNSSQNFGTENNRFFDCCASRNIPINVQCT